MNLQWEFLLGWFIGMILIYALSTLWYGIRAAWLYTNNWGSRLSDKVNFLSAMPTTFVETYVGCLLYNIETGKFVAIDIMNDSSFLVKFAWRDNSEDILLINDSKWGYVFHPEHRLQKLTKFVGDDIPNCVFVPCKIYYTPHPKVKVFGIQEGKFILSGRKCYVQLDHLNSFKATRFLCNTEYGQRTMEELEELEARICVAHNQVEIFNGSLEELTDRYGLCNTTESGIIEWCQSSGHAFQITIGGAGALLE